MKHFRFRWLITAVATVLWLCTGAPHAFSQATNTGTVVGNVSDPSGAVISGAAVTLTNSSTGASFTAASNGTGQFVFSAVPLGVYDMVTTKSGFNTTKTTGITVNVGTQTTTNIKLTVGGGHETVEVQVMGTELQTLNSTVGQTISQEAISFAAQPQPRRQYLHRAAARRQPRRQRRRRRQRPEHVPARWRQQLQRYGRQQYRLQHHRGLRRRSRPAARVPPPSGILPTPTDSVDEVKVNTANQTADFDNSSGAQVEFVTPRGTNRWHGGAYEYYLDNGFNANSWDNNHTGTQLPSTTTAVSAPRPVASSCPACSAARWYIFGFYEGYRFPHPPPSSAPFPADT